MTDYNNTNSGLLFKNDRKAKDTHPDYTGSYTFECPHCHKKSEHWLSSWIKTNTKGKFMSLANKPKEEIKGATQEAAATLDVSDVNDEIPF